MRTACKWHRILLFVLTACAVAVTVGCGGGGGGGGGGPTPGDTTSPTVSGVIISPSSLTFVGGTVTITATVTDAGGVATVYASIVSSLTGAKPNVTMTNTTGNTYECQFTAPANAGPEGTAETYSVRIHATDTSTNSTTSPVSTFVVEAVPGPPPPPI